MEWDKMSIKELYTLSGITRKKLIEVFNLNPNTLSKVLTGERKLMNQEKEHAMRLYLRSLIQMNIAISKFF